VKIPSTSTTLLRDLAKDSGHARWGEFVDRYRSMMEAYMREHFPAVDVDDAVQDTLVALIKEFPGYCYSPKESGAFRNYLT
jgi:DNA-directed RNA polymerase specialized sigma24 family protein